MSPSARLDTSRFFLVSGFWVSGQHCPYHLDAMLSLFFIFVFRDPGQHYQSNSTLFCARVSARRAAFGYACLTHPGRRSIGRSWSNIARGLVTSADCSSWRPHSISNTTDGFSWRCRPEPGKSEGGRTFVAGDGAGEAFAGSVTVCWERDVSLA